MTKSNTKIGKTFIGPDYPTYFIAEIGSNFDGDIKKAKSIISLAKECGADAVKFQHYLAETLVHPTEFEALENKTHQASWRDTVFNIYKKAALPKEWTAELAEYAKKAEIDFFTSPYSFELADYVDEYVPAYKIGSGDITWLDYIEYVAKKNKPILIATGASTDEEVEAAVNAITMHNKQLILMQCNTNYTAEKDNYSHMNLNVLQHFRKKYPNVILGLSDHMPGHSAVLGAIALGARVIEKHFTYDNTQPGPDHPFSLVPKTWVEMIKNARELEAALGDGVKKVEENENGSRIVQRRGIYLKENVVKGEMINKENLAYLRPCSDNMLPPSSAGEIVGKIAIRDIPSLNAVTLKDVK